MLASALSWPAEGREVNEILRRALYGAGLSEEAVAARLGVDPKTVRRWLEGRLPYPRLRWELATLLGTDETDLWPDVATARATRSRPAEVVAIYAHRSSISADGWCAFFGNATEEIAILSYSSLFIAGDASLVSLLCAKSDNAVRVRIALADPDHWLSDELAGPRELDATIAAQARDALRLYERLRHTRNAEIRLHQSALYNSIYRSDADLLVCQHIYGVAEAESPVLHLSNGNASEMAGTYLLSFEQLWSSARPA